VEVKQTLLQAYKDILQTFERELHDAIDKVAEIEEDLEGLIGVEVTRKRNSQVLDMLSGVKEEYGIA
jgi:hypothetical protein